MHVAGKRRVGKIPACGQQVVGVFLEKEGRLAAWVMPHLDRMVGIVTPDAVDPAHREEFGSAFYGKQNGLREGDDGGGEGHCELVLFIGPRILDGKRPRGKRSTSDLAVVLHPDIAALRGENWRFARLCAMSAA